jgi:hypothetical protein
VVIKTDTDSEYILTITYKDEDGDTQSYDTPNLKGSGGGGGSVTSVSLNGDDVTLPDNTGNVDLAIGTEDVKSLDDILSMHVSALNVENEILLPELGVVTIPIAATEGDKINPLYVGHYASLASAEMTVPANNFIDYTVDSPVPKDNFGFNSGSGKVFTAQVTDSQKRLLSCVPSVTIGLGDPVKSIVLPGEPNNAFAYNYDWISLIPHAEAPFASFCDIETSQNSYGSGALSLWFTSGIKQPIYIKDKEGFTTGWQPDFVVEYDGRIVTWNLATRTLTFNYTVQIKTMSDLMSSYKFLNNMTIAPYTFETVGVWVDTGTDIGSPDYPRVIYSGESQTGVITGTRLTELVKASRYMLPILDTPDETFDLRGVVTGHNPNASWDGQAWSVIYASRSDTIVYSSTDIDNGAVITIFYSGSGETIILNDGSGWVYPAEYFDPQSVFNMTEAFYFQSVTGIPWNDERLVDYRVVRLSDVAEKQRTIATDLDTEVARAIEAERGLDEAIDEVTVLAGNAQATADGADDTTIESGETASNPSTSNLAATLTLFRKDGSSVDVDFTNIISNLVNKTGANANGSTVFDNANSDDGLAISDTQPGTETIAAFETNHEAGNPVRIGHYLKHISNAIDNYRLVGMIDSNGAKKLFLLKNKVSAPSTAAQIDPNDEVLNKGEIVTAINSAIGAIEMGLPFPNTIELESGLPDISSGAVTTFNYIIENMDVSSTDAVRQGQAWVAQGGTAWTKVVDLVNQLSLAAFKQLADGSWVLADDIQALIDGAVQGSQIQTTEPIVDSTDTQIPSAKRIWTMMGAALSTLTTTAKTIVGAINELKGAIPGLPVSIANGGTGATTALAAQMALTQNFAVQAVNPIQGILLSIPNTMGSIFTGSLLVSIMYGTDQYRGQIRIDFSVNRSNSQTSGATLVYNSTPVAVTQMMRSYDGTYTYAFFKMNPSSVAVLHAEVIGLVGSTGTTGGLPLNPAFVTPTTTSTTTPPGSGLETYTLKPSFDLSAALLALPVIS